MQPSSIQAVIFDFDLTLADSSDAIVDCTQYALTHLKCRESTPAQIRAVIGLSLPVMFQTLSDDTDPDRAAAFVKHFVTRADAIMVQSTRIYPEVPALLADLRADGLSVAIVSTKYRHRIDAILKVAGLRDQVDVLIGGEDVQRHKPDPEGIAQALGRLSIRAAQAVYVGDHAVDAQAAAQAGTGFIGMVTGTTSHAAWREAGKMAVKDHVGEVASLVRAMRAARYGVSHPSPLTPADAA